MRTTLKAAFLGIAVAVLGGCPAWGQSPPAVDSLGRALVENQPGGAVIGVLRDDSSSVHSFGRADSTGSAPSAHTLFEIGSITKTFTGLLLADAIERGTVDPSTPVRSLLPDSIALAPAESTTITLEHLATHRSGLPRLPSNLAATARPADPYAAYGDSALYAFLDGYAPPRASGTSFEYSNLGTGLLGHLLARRADTTYAALVRQRIAEPLGLSDTRVHLTADQQARFAQGHNRAGAPASPWHFDALAGAGALRSTAADLLAYLRAHRTALRAAPDTATPLQRAMQRALSPRAAAGDGDAQIGLGWHETERNGHRVAWHNGGTGGFRTFIGLNRTSGHGVVVLVNTAVSSRRVTKGGIRLLDAGATD